MKIDYKKWLKNYNQQMALVIFSRFICNYFMSY